MSESGASNELPILLGGASDAPETLMLIGTPGPNGVVHVRGWTSDDWSAVPFVRAERAASLLAWIEREVARGRTMNQSLYAIRLWLGRDEMLNR
jgi:hypothetical protein